MKETARKIKSSLRLNEVDHIATSFKLLADPTRLKILHILFSSSQGMCVNELADEVGISQSAMSHQLAKLESHNVVESFREGQMICYAIKRNTITQNLERVINVFK